MTFEQLQGNVINYGIRLIIGLAILYVGFKAVNLFTKKLAKVLEKRGYDPSLRPYLMSLISWTLKIAIFIVAASQMGIETTSFVALLGAAGLAVGIALQGSLSNFSGGVMLLILRPFHVGDYIEVLGYSGTVKKLSVFNTVLATADNQIVYLPNGPVSTSPIKNVTQEDTRRVDFVFGISYEDNIDEAKSILKETFSEDTRVLGTPVPEFLVKELADSSVNLAARVWVKTSDYWNVLFDNNEKVKKAFDKNGITIPFPQTDFNMRDKGMLLTSKKEASQSKTIN